MNAGWLARGMHQSRDTHDARGVIESSHEQPDGPDRDSLLRIEIYGPAETKASRPSHEPAAPTQGFQAPPPLRTRPQLVQPPAESEDESDDRPEPTERDQAISAHEEDIARREADLVRREEALSGSEGLVEAGTADVERRERKLKQMEHTIHERMQELDDRELEVERREAELEGAFGLREDRVEIREAELAELEERLRRKEEDLARYIGQVQAQLAQRG